VRRVVVTGVGIVGPAGMGLPALAQALRSGRSFTRVTFPEQGLLGAPACEEGLEGLLDRREARRLDRGAQLFAAAARLALADAGLDRPVAHPDRAGVFEGTALGGLGATLAEQAWLLGSAGRRPRPGMAVTGQTGSGSGFVALAAALHGPAVTISSGSVSSALAIGSAVDQIRLGVVDWAIAGGGEAPLCLSILELLTATGMLSSRAEEAASACRPFDVSRDGTVLAEGGAALILEAREHAHRRGAPVRGGIRSVATTTDAVDMVAPANDAGARARCLRLALEGAGLAAGSLDLVAAHGTATRANDPVESRALRAAFGAAGAAVPVVGLKSGLGHALGACTAVEVVCVLAAIEGGFVPPTLHLTQPDPECPLALVRGSARETPVRRALVHSAGFGGRNAALVIVAPDLE